MTGSSMPLLRRAAAWAKAHLCTLPVRFSIIVAIVVAVASSAHADTLVMGSRIAEKTPASFVP